MILQIGRYSYYLSPNLMEEIGPNSEVLRVKYLNISSAWNNWKDKNDIGTKQTQNVGNWTFKKPSVLIGKLEMEITVDNRH